MCLRITLPEAGTAESHVGAAVDSCTIVPLWSRWTTGDEGRLNCALAGLDGFVSMRHLLGANRKSGIAVDEGSQSICLFEVAREAGSEHGKETIRRRVVGYGALAEIKTDGGLPNSRGVGVTEMVSLKLCLNVGGMRHETTINLLAKPQQRGSRNHQIAALQSKEWQVYLVGLMHLPGLLAFGASKARESRECRS